MKTIVILIILSFLIRAHVCELQLGSTVNVFTRYGYLSWSMRVLPETISNVFLEPTKSIYNHKIEKQDAPKPLITLDLSFCETVEQLFQSYFKNYRIEGLQGDGIWKGFAGQWEENKKLAALKLGINETYLNQHYSFVFVRINRSTQRPHSIPDDFNFKDDLKKDVVGFLNGISVGNSSNVLEFIRTYGSHYIHSYTLGDSIYQVYVLKRRKLRVLRNIYKTNRNVDYRKYFSPWYVEHIGAIRKASSSVNSNIETWINKKWMQRFHIMKYPSIFKLSSQLNVESRMKDRKRAQSIEHILFSEEVLVQLELKSLSGIMPNVASKIHFREVLHNQMSLWEENQ